MNAYIVAGILATALGAFLLYYGAGRSAEGDKKEVLQKIELFSKELHDAKNNDVTGRVSQIEGKFDKWAETVLLDPKSLDLKHQSHKLELEKTKATLFGENRFFYEYIFSALEKLSAAYNSKKPKQKIAFVRVRSGKKQGANILEASIRFTPKNIWNVRVDYVRPNERSETLPSIHFDKKRLGNKSDSQRPGFVIFPMIGTDKKYAFVRDTEGEFVLPSMKNQISFSEYESGLDTLLQEFFESQLITARK